MRFRPLRPWLLPVALLAALVLATWGLARLRGPVLPGYEVAAGPLVQDVVATGRVAAPSRVQVGAEIAGLVLERRVADGDRVAPGDVLVVLRARDLEAKRDEARLQLMLPALAGLSVVHALVPPHPGDCGRPRCARCARRTGSGCGRG